MVKMYNFKENEIKVPTDFSDTHNPIKDCNLNEKLNAVQDVLINKERELLFGIYSKLFVDKFIRYANHTNQLLSRVFFDKIPLTQLELVKYNAETKEIYFDATFFYGFVLKDKIILLSNIEEQNLNTTLKVLSTTIEEKLEEIVHSSFSMVNQLQRSTQVLTIVENIMKEKYSLYNDLEVILNEITIYQNGEVSAIVTFEKDFKPYQVINKPLLINLKNQTVANAFIINMTFNRAIREFLQNPRKIPVYALQEKPFEPYIVYDDKEQKFDFKVSAGFGVLNMDKEIANGVANKLTSLCEELATIRNEGIQFTFKIAEYTDIQKATIGYINPEKFNVEEFKSYIRNFSNQVHNFYREHKEESNIVEILRQYQYNADLKIGFTNYKCFGKTGLVSILYRNKPINNIDERIFFYNGKIISQKEFYKLKAQLKHLL